MTGKRNFLEKADKSEIEIFPVVVGEDNTVQYHCKGGGGGGGGGDAILSGQVISLDAFVAVYYYNIKLYVIFF